MQQLYKVNLTSALYIFKDLSYILVIITLKNLITTWKYKFLEIIVICPSSQYYIFLAWSYILQDDFFSKLTSLNACGYDQLLESLNDIPVCQACIMLFFSHKPRFLKFGQASWSPVCVGTNSRPCHFVDTSLPFCLPWHRSLTCLNSL